MDMTEAVIKVTGSTPLSRKKQGERRHELPRKKEQWSFAAVKGALQVHVGQEDGAGNGGEARGHALVNLGGGEVGDVRLDHAGGFTLADEGGCGSDNSFGTRDAHGAVRERESNEQSQRGGKSKLKAGIR